QLLALPGAGRPAGRGARGDPPAAGRIGRSRFGDRARRLVGTGSHNRVTGAGTCRTADLVSAETCRETPNPAPFPRSRFLGLATPGSGDAFPARGPTPLCPVRVQRIDESFMSKLLNRLAHVCVCVALALPTLPAGAMAQKARASAGGPERLIQARADAAVPGA